MPELPEVETVRAGLERMLVGRRFVRIDQRRRDLRFALPERFAERLAGRRVESLGRRAKYILIRLDNGEVLVVHLGMTGRFSVRAPSRRAGGEGIVLGDYVYDHGGDARHDHLVFTMSDGSLVTYNDARRFGYMELVPEAEMEGHPFFAGLGVEPLSDDLTPAYLAARARGRKVDLKALLMDQRIVAGLGNIYVCEALFRAGLDPFKRAATLATKTGKAMPAAVRLVAAIKSVLAEAVRAGGSTLRDYKQADGSLGRFQNEFAVYGREGQRCLRRGCRGTVRRKVQGGRSTFYCPVCQR